MSPGRELTLAFCGAAGTVTGSCYWIEHPGGQFLVDCGLFQGPKTLKELNYGRFPFDPAEIDFVLLTHAHIDHAGLIPKLAARGFQGPVYATEATRDLLSFMLPDSGQIQETEVERLNRRNARRGRPQVSPIYTRADAEAVMSQVRAVDFAQEAAAPWRDVGEGVRARWWNAGHILGAASVEVELATGRKGYRRLRLLFSGDIGPEHKLFHPDPEAPENFDYVALESTYGDTERPRLSPAERRGLLAEEVRQALRRGGNLMIPSFAVERTQELLYDLGVLFDAGEIPEAPVFLDSPLAIKATETFARHAHDLEDLGTEEQPTRAELFRRGNVRFTETVEESKGIARFTGGAIIMAGSGMCDAGRIRHHLKHNLWRPQATLLLVGYQAPGTLGRILQDGAPAVRIHGEEVEVRAQVRTLDAYTGHADRRDLVEWLRERMPVSRTVFLTHGEEPALTALKARLVDNGVPEEQILIPRLDDRIDLMGGKAPKRRAVPRRAEPEGLAGADWHNRYAALLLDLRRSLERAEDDRAREALLERLRRALKTGT